MSARMTPPTITDRAAQRAYEGSTLRRLPWDDLPREQQTTWKCTLAHLLAPRGDRRAAVQAEIERARYARMQEMAGLAA